MSHISCIVYSVLLKSLQIHSGDLHLASLVLSIAALTICQQKFHDHNGKKKA